MKPVLLIIFSIISFEVSAQLKLKTGMQILSHITTSSESELGFGMNTNSDTESDFSIVVNEEKKNVFELTSKFLNLKMQMKMMGQETSFDSKNEKDKESPTGKKIMPLIGVENKYMINKTDGKVFPLIKKELPKESGAEVMPGLDNLDESKKIQDMFLVITPQQKTAGTWKVVDSTEGNVSTTVFTIDSVKNDEMFISYSISAVNNSNMEQMGMTTKLKMTTTGKGEIITDVTTGISKRNKLTLESNGSIEIAEQSSDFTQKTTSITTYMIVH